MDVIFMIFYFLYGLAIGSFLNVVIYRLPIHMPIAKGRSMCPKCSTTLTSLDLVPVFSFLFLKGKCRYCKASISYIYPIVELLTAVLFTMSYLIYGPTLYSVVMCLFICVLIVAAGIDLKHKYIPDRLSVIIICLAIISFLLNPLVSVKSRLLGAFVISGIMYIISYFTGGGIGGGDIKLFFATGLLLGLKLNILSFLLGYLIAGLTIIVPYIKKQLPKNHEVPMAPYFAVSLTFAALFGEQFLWWYLGLI
ncbi:MAG: A24 family peptidase [Sedimentibacter sp.]